MLVDPEVLRAFATEVDTASAEIGGLNVSGVATTAADGLPGSETQWAARLIGEHLGLAASDLIKDVESMGKAIRGSGDQYEVDDADLAGAFKGLF